MTPYELGKLLANKDELLVYYPDIEEEGMKEYKRGMTETALLIKELLLKDATETQDKNLQNNALKEVIKIMKDNADLIAGKGTTANLRAQREVRNIVKMLGAANIDDATKKIAKLIKTAQYYEKQKN